MTTNKDSRKVSTQSAMEKFGCGGMALLPWTKQILCVVWEQLRMLVQVIYISFMSVFQLLRFEVHLSITDESGQHVQHIGTTTNPTESFLFSSLFDGDSGVMVGGSNPLSNFCGDVADGFPGGAATAEALLSSLRGDDLCCGLVDDLVSIATGQEDGLFVGKHPSWKMGWNIFAPGNDNADSSHKSTGEVLKQDLSEEEKSPNWSSEEDQSQGDFDNEESRALWESLSKSSDPYNPFFFSACISTNTNMEKAKARTQQVPRSASAAESVSKGKQGEELNGSPRLDIWVSRSDSESSWGSSDGSCADLDRDESERLWELFSQPLDPYNPMYFTACTGSDNPPPQHTPPPATLPIFLQASCRASSAVRSSTQAESAATPSLSPWWSSSSSDDEEDQLWKSLCQSSDPYHPLNFQACLESPDTPLTPKPKHGGDLPYPSKIVPDQSPHAPEEEEEEEEEEKEKEKEKEKKAAVPQAVTLESPACHHTPLVTRRPWKRNAGSSCSSALERSRVTTGTTPTVHKQVRFSPVVHVHVMRSWPFARRACRKGPWEEMARDRDRFRRRIADVEKAIGHCFTRQHRERIRTNLQLRWTGLPSLP